MKKYENLPEIEAFAKEHIKKSRFEHCQRVAQMCIEMCKKFNLDTEKGYLIGISHDMCKDFPSDKMIELAQKDGHPILKMEREKTALLHGRAAAVLLKEKFGIDDKEIEEAIANHTSGVVGMCDYSKVLYLADKIEPGRKYITKEYVDELFTHSLDEMVYIVGLRNLEYLKITGETVYPVTLEMMEEFRKKLGL